MKLRSGILFVVMLLSFILSACQPASATNGTISFMVSGNPAELAAYQKLVDAFKAKNASVEVELIHIPDEAEYRTRLAADVAAGTPADVILINYRRQAAFSNAGAFTPLDSYIAQSEQLKPEDFYPQAFNAFRWNNNQMCIPQNLSSLVIYYNKDLFTAANVPFPAADWTWDDFLATARALTRDTDGDGKTDQFGVGLDPVLLRLAPFIWQAGGELVDNDEVPNTLVINDPIGIEATTFFFELQTEYHVVPNQEEEIARDSQSRFLDGALAMYFNSRRPVPTFRESATFDWDVTALPRYKEAATVLHADGYCIPSASKNKDAAWAFIEFANSVEGQTIVAGTGRTVPSRIAVANSPAFLDPNAKPANSQVFLDVIPTIHALPLYQNWVEIEEITNEEIERGFYGQTDAYNALNTATNRSIEIFNEP